MKKTVQEDLQDIYRLSGELEKLAEKLSMTPGNKETLSLFGTILDTAHKLRLAADNLWKDAEEQ